MLPHTKTAKAMELAERLRKIIEDMKIETPEREIVRVTASFGVASLRKQFRQTASIERGRCHAL